MTSSHPSTDVAPRCRILHLEDNAIDGELVSEYLTAEGLVCDITRIWTRADFTSALEKRGYDLILADHQLPHFDGDAALEIAHRTSPDIPFIFVSGTLGEEVAVEALKRGATDYVVKQRLERLPAVVRRALAEVTERRRRRDFEEALLQSERELQIALRAGRFGVWSLDLETRAMNASAICKAVFGRGVDETFSYQDFLGSIHPEDRGRVEGAFKASVESQEDYDVEFRILTTDGRVRWLGFRGQAIYRADGSAARLVGISSDIDRRKRDETFRLALIGLEDSFRERDDPADLAYAAAEVLAVTLEVSRAGYGVIDPEAETITIDRDWNASGIKSLAGTLHFRDYGSYIDDLKRGHTVVFADADKDPRTAANAPALKAISAQAVINMPILERGRFVALLYLNHASPRHWSEADLNFVREVAARTRTVVERRRVELELREGEQHYRFAAELNPQVAWTANPDGQLDRVAERWREWTGSSGLGDSWSLVLHPDDLERTVQAWARSISAGVPYDIEHRVRMVSGDYQWARSRAFPRRDAGGDVVKWYGSTEDIHEQKLLQDALQDFNAELEQRVQARTAELQLAQEALRQSQKLEAMGQLTGGVAHDFNNLLTPIVGSLDMLQRRDIGGEREKRLIEGALQAAERARVLVQRLLAFARRQPLKSGPIDVGALIEGMADLVASTSGPQIKVVVDADPRLPPAVADPNQLEMAILNLCVNARDAMPHGGTLTITAHNDTAAHGEGVKPGRYVRVCIADTGVGMDSATLARAIEPFFSTKGVGKGTGLGLSMVHGLVLQLGGSMHVKSKPGLGTNVILLLPVSDRPIQSEEVSSSGARAAAVKGTALLVDDEDLVRASTSDMLTEIGYRVVEASSAEMALGLVEDGLLFDILITDHMMPGMSGVDLAREIRHRHADASILIVSGYADADAVAPDLPRLTKPFRQQDLVASLEGQR